MAARPAPDYLSATSLRKASFYSIENAYRNFPKDGAYITCRGPLFTDCYDRYAFKLDGVEGPVIVIAPEEAAAGQAVGVSARDLSSRDAVVDLALLAKGFHIVIGPVGYNDDGPQLASWNAVYKHLTEHGFSKKPVMEGAGGAAGEVYAWAIANPDKVACIYAENPVLRRPLRATRRLTTLLRWPKPACRCCTFAAARTLARKPNSGCREALQGSRRQYHGHCQRGRPISSHNFRRAKADCRFHHRDCPLTAAPFLYSHAISEERNITHENEKNLCPLAGPLRALQSSPTPHIAPRANSLPARPRSALPLKPTSRCTIRCYAREPRA